MRVHLPSALVLLIALSIHARAWAAPDSFGAGSGRDGEATITQAGVGVNAYAGLSSDAPSGQSTLALSSSDGFASGDLVLVWQHARVSADDGAGRYELARVSERDAQTLTLVDALTYPYPAGASQVVRVPEYSRLTVQGGGSLVAAPFDGTSGGILVLMVGELLTNDGTLGALGAGATSDLHVPIESGRLGMGRGSVSAAGGGVVLVRAWDIQGLGNLDASGATEAGSGRGGSGGTIEAWASLRLSQNLTANAGLGSAPSEGGHIRARYGLEEGSDVQATADAFGAGAPGVIELDDSRSLPVDSDADGVLDVFEGSMDTDEDGLADYLDGDDDGDSLPTIDEIQVPDGNPTGGPDADADGVPDYLDEDDDGDGVSTLAERLGGVRDVDLDGDGVPDYLDAQRNGAIAPLDPNDVDGDGIPNDEDADDDGDGLHDEIEDVNQDGDLDDDDSDGDGLPDYQDRDDDNDGVWSRYERGQANTRLDTDGDGVPDSLDDDDDGDGIPTADEDPDPNGDGDPADARITAGRRPDYLSDDDDGDGIPTTDERPGGEDRDSDGDGLPDHLDDDDDNDGVPTSVEAGGNSGTTDGGDGGIPDYLDPDVQGQGTTGGGTASGADAGVSKPGADAGTSSVDAGDASSPSDTGDGAGSSDASGASPKPRYASPKAGGGCSSGRGAGHSMAAAVMLAVTLLGTRRSRRARR